MKKDLIKHLQHYVKLSDENVDLIIANTEEKCYRATDFFISSGERCSKMAFLIEGVFRFWFFDTNGNELTSHFMKEQDFVTNIASFFEYSVSSGSIQAETDCSVVELSRASWDMFCKRIPDWESSFQKIANETLIAKVSFQRGLINLDAKAAYLEFLKTYPTILQRVPLNHIASFLGITPFSLSRIRKSITSIEH